MTKMTTERAIEVLRSNSQVNHSRLKRMEETPPALVEYMEAIDKAIEVMGINVIDKLEVRLRSLERGEYHPHDYIRIDEVKDLIEAFKEDLL